MHIVSTLYSLYLHVYPTTDHRPNIDISNIKNYDALGSWGLGLTLDFFKWNVFCTPQAERKGTQAAVIQNHTSSLPQLRPRSLTWAFLGSSAVAIAPTWGCFRTASLCPRNTVSNLRLSPFALHSHWLHSLKCNDFVCLSHQCRTLYGSDELARPLHLLDALLAGIGTELSDVPRDIGHTLVVKEFRDRRQPKSIAVPEHVFVNDRASLAHVQKIDFVSIFEEPKTRQDCDLRLEWVVCPRGHDDEDLLLLRCRGAGRGQTGVGHSVSCYCVRGKVQGKVEVTLSRVLFLLAEISQPI